MRILVIGATNVDLVGVGIQPLIPHDSNIGRVDIVVGGVGKNIAEDLKLLRTDLGFLTFLGNDPFAKIVADHLDRLGLDYNHSIWLNNPSPKYLAIHQPDGALESAINDLAAVEHVDTAEIEKRKEYIEEFDVLVLDANLSQAMLDFFFDHFPQKTFIVDGVSQTKVLRVRTHLAQISLLKVNARELAALVENPALDIRSNVQTLLNLGVRQVIATNGPDPITYNVGQAIFQTPILPAKIMRSSVGCGDALLAATIYGLSLGKDLHEALRYGKKAAALTMEVYSPCNPELSPERLEE
jgi:pseudouridine kinase